MSDAAWKDDSIQFPRLLAEIHASGALDEKDWDDICEEMDITSDQLGELFDRADIAWQEIKKLSKESGRRVRLVEDIGQIGTVDAISPVKGVHVNWDHGGEGWWDEELLEDLSGIQDNGVDELPRNNRDA